MGEADAPPTPRLIGLTKTKKRQVLRKAHILITETNELFGKLDNKLAKELVEIDLTDLRQRMKQLLGISRKKLKRENMDEIFEASLLYGDSNNRMLNEEGDWILDRCEVCGKFFEDLEDSGRVTLEE